MSAPARGGPGTGPAARRPSPPDAAGGLVESLREAHLEMMDAVLAGDGLERVAEIAARATGAPVALVVPRLGVAVLAPRAAASAAELAGISRYVADRLRDRPARVPARLAAEVPITAGDERVGAVAVLAESGDGETVTHPHAREFLHIAAVASLTEVAVAEARDEVEQNLRGSLLEELRDGGELDVDDVIRRASRLGCDLRRGAVVLCAQLTSERPRHVVTTIGEEHSGALAQHMDDRVYALLPALPEPASAEETLAAARAVAERLERHGVVGLSSYYADPGELRRAVQEAELVLEVLTVSDAPIAQDIGTGTYRLLFRVLASHPEEVRSFYEETVARIVAYDAQYSTDLVGTLEAYLEQNCNMNATASAIYAHRHTVAYRLDRVRELTGLDPALAEDRERLGLGLKAYRVIAPRLPR